MNVLIYMIVAFALGAIVADVSGAIFAYFVFRTKRDSHERMFGGPMMGGAYQSDPVDGDMIRQGDMMIPPEPPPFPNVTEMFNRRFIDQINAERAKQGIPPITPMSPETGEDSNASKYNE